MPKIKKNIPKILLTLPLNTREWASGILHPWIMHFWELENIQIWIRQNFIYHIAKLYHA